jgi:hypothetical protein
MTPRITAFLLVLLVAACASPQAPTSMVKVPEIGPEGSFSKVTSHTVNTVGGVAPRAGCSQATAGTPARVNYTADYYFFTAK